MRPLSKLALGLALTAAACSSFSSSGSATDAGLDPDAGADAPPAPETDGGIEAAPEDAGADSVTCAPALATPTPPGDTFSCADAGAPFLCADFDEPTPQRYVYGTASGVGPVSAATSFQPPGLSPDNAMQIAGGKGGFEVKLPTTTTSAIAASVDVAVTVPPNAPQAFFTIAVGPCDVNLKFEKLPSRIGVDSHCGNAFYDHHDLTSADLPDTNFHRFTIGVDVCRQIASASVDGQKPAVFAIAPTVATDVARVTIGPSGAASMAFDNVFVVVR